MAVKVPSFIGMCHRQSAEYATPYKPKAVPKLRGFYNPREAKPAPCVQVYTKPTQVECGPEHEHASDHPSSKFNARMARFVKR